MIPLLSCSDGGDEKDQQPEGNMKNFKALDNTAAEHKSLRDSGYYPEFKELSDLAFCNSKDPLIKEAVADWLEERNCPGMARNWREAAKYQRFWKT